MRLTTNQASADMAQIMGCLLRKRMGGRASKKYMDKLGGNLTGFDLLILTYFEGLMTNRIDT